jgi:hypothetical protein
VVRGKRTAHLKRRVGERVAPRNSTLHALDIETGKARATVQVGATSRFATPTLFGDRVFIGTMNGVVAVTVS